MAVFLLLAALLLPQGSRAPQVAVPNLHGLSQQTLLSRLGERRRPLEERMVYLEELAVRGEPLPLEPLMAARSSVRGEWWIDFTRCLRLCGPGALPELHRMLKKSDPVVKAEAVYAVVNLDRGGGEGFAREVLSGRWPVEARVAALRGLDARGSLFAHLESLRRLETAEGPLLMECLQVLRRSPSLEDAPYLVDLLHRREGRAANEAVRLLQQLTGYKIGRDPRSWRYWMLKHRAAGTDFRAASPQGGNGEDETITYLGVPILGEKVVFVLDSSGSMETPLPENPSKTRGSRAVEELVQLLPRLPEEAAFDVVFFETEIECFAGKLVPRDEENLSRAAGWLQRHRFVGGTNLHDGLRRAFENDGVEEIFLLSDGEPTVGELIDPGRIAARVARWNRWRNVRVNTISFGAPPEARDFLYRLASDHGGICRVIW